MAKRKVFTSPSTVGLKKWATGQHVSDLQIFLQRFGYLRETSRNSDFAALRDTSVPSATRGVFDEATEIALRSYQKFHGLPVTGELDQLTVFQMRKPRCGFPDLPVDTGLSRFVLHRNRWDRRDLTYKIANPTGAISTNKTFAMPSEKPLPSGAPHPVAFYRDNCWPRRHHGQICRFQTGMEWRWAFCRSPC
jgi:peptidoglycan hydrolase-like protein with peptidoglycan-binding domain